MVAAARWNKGAPLRLLLVGLTAAGGGVVRWSSNRAGRFGGVHHEVDFVLGPRRHGGASSGVVARTWSLSRSPVGAVQYGDSVAGASSWMTMQEHGPWCAGGGSGGFPRRRRRGGPDLGLEMLGDDPRSTRHKVYSFADGGALHRLRKPLDGDGVLPVLGATVQAARRSLDWEERRPWCRWCLGTSRDVCVILSFLRSFLHMFCIGVPSRCFWRCLRVLFALV